jgi:hypothetical protein
MISSIIRMRTDRRFSDFQIPVGQIGLHLRHIAQLSHVPDLDSHGLCSEKDRAFLNSEARNESN